MRVHIGKRTDSRTDGRGRGSGQPDLGSTSRRGRRQALEEQQPRPRGGGRRRRATISSARAVMQQQRTDGAGGERTRRAHLLERTRRAEEGKCDDDLRHLHAHVCVCLSAPTIHTKERARPETRSEWGRRQGRKEAAHCHVGRLCW